MVFGQLNGFVSAVGNQIFPFTRAKVCSSDPGSLRCVKKVVLLAGQRHDATVEAIWDRSA